MKKVLNKYLPIILIVLAILIFTIYLIFNMNNHYIKYENEVGDKYKIELTLKDDKVVKAYTTITFNSKDKKEQEKAAKSNTLTNIIQIKLTTKQIIIDLL